MNDVIERSQWFLLDHPDLVRSHKNLFMELTRTYEGNNPSEICKSMANIIRLRDIDLADELDKLAIAFSGVTKEEMLLSREHSKNHPATMPDEQALKLMRIIVDYSYIYPTFDEFLTKHESKIAHSDSFRCWIDNNLDKARTMYLDLINKST